MITFYPGASGETVRQTIAELTADNVIARIWDYDHTLWSEYPDDILNRLGWLNITESMRPHLEQIVELAEEVRADGFEEVVVLGMGGASLVAEVFDSLFQDTQPGLKVTVQDSTHPDAIHALVQRLDLTKTLFIYSMKKWALETYSLLKFFYNAVVEEVGQKLVGQHFLAITDVGAWVSPFAEKLKFRKTIFNDPMLGGRYAALSHVGLVPAALRGVDITRLIVRAQRMTDSCKLLNLTLDDNAAGWLGAAIGGYARGRRDKLTFMASPSVASWLTWVEQLLAESTGKGGTGILPVIEHDPADPDAYGDDRVFVFLEDGSAFDSAFARLQERLAESRHPSIHIHLSDAYGIGGQFVLWSMAVVVAGRVLGIQPFNQPNVEATKIETTSVLEQYAQTQSLPQYDAVAAEQGVQVFGDGISGANVQEALSSFLARMRPGDYAAVHAYLPPDAGTSDSLEQLQRVIRQRSGCATTIGYAPRLLHSTGQLHKGDAGNGHFMQITSEPGFDIPVPRVAGGHESDYTFGVLLEAQASGDWQALRKRQRYVMRLHLTDGVQQGLDTLLTLLRN